MELSPLCEILDQAAEQVRPVVEQLARELWQRAEISLQEVQSARLLIQALQAEGFMLTSAGTAGVPTSFIAQWGDGSPTLGILAEYDALPGLGNEPLAHKQARGDGVTSGHGCGHNLLGAAAVGTAMALKQVMIRQQLPGTLRLYGCAAEETEGAKVYMARAGCFHDLDAALHWHPGEGAAVMAMKTMAMNSLRIEFFGKTAHAGSEPWLGRSAVHAAELFAHSINLMRAHTGPATRLHYVYDRAGDAPNVIPDYASLRLSVRDINRARVDAWSAWIKQAARGAALATQTRAQARVYYGLHDLLPNRPLAQRMQSHLQRIGVPSYTAEEHAFARELASAFGVTPQGMATTVDPLPGTELVAGFSTDVGDVSWNAPTIGCSLPTVPRDISLHTWAATASHGTHLGIKGACAAVRVLVAIGGDLLTDPTLLQQARAAFAQATGGKAYQSPLDPAMTGPQEIPDWVRQQALEETMLLTH